jgi:hypothetical protein
MNGKRRYKKGICIYCKVEKDLSEFYPRSKNSEFRSSVCKQCSLLRCKKLSENPDFKLHRKEYMLGWYYGIALEEYNKIFELQKGCCAICGIHQSELKQSLSIDHDHETGEVRGLLCHLCNRGLGYFKDDVNIITKASDYLKNCK